MYEYFTSMIDNIGINELRSLVRFITGSSVCSSSGISVTFNSLSGLSRRPIAHRVSDQFTDTSISRQCKEGTPLIMHQRIIQHVLTLQSKNILAWSLCSNAAAPQSRYPKTADFGGTTRFVDIAAEEVQTRTTAPLMP